MERISALEDAIEKKSLVGIYSVFYTIAHGDPNFSTGKFRDVLQYVQDKKIEGVMQEFDGENFEPEEKWDEDYWAFIASSLIDNFCYERIDLLEAIGKKIYPVKKAEQAKNATLGKDMHIPENVSVKEVRSSATQGQRQSKRLISEEKKSNIKSNHANRSNKDGGRLLSKIIGRGSGR